ncbi:protein-serine,threonine phosphatase [Sarracenia purpurea var. burkii]
MALMLSSLFASISTAFKREFQRSISGQEGLLQDSLGVLIHQGKLLFGSNRLFHSLPFLSFSELDVLLQPGTVAAAQLNLHIVNRRRNLSVVGALSCTLSIPSVSGPSFQICGYPAAFLWA